MTSTIVTHVYNEEFLLDSWIRHHRDVFDHGIVVDFNSTDQSMDVVKELAPHWTIVQSPLLEFSAEPLDRLIESIERELSGTRMTLTVTEFLLGNPRELLSEQLIVPSIDLINMPFDPPFNPDLPWHEQRVHGIHYKSTSKFRSNLRGRSIHKINVNYPVGRHFDGSIGGSMLIYRVAGCLVNEKMIERRLQIQSKIPVSDVLKNYGVQHHDFGRGLTREKLLEQELYEQSISLDLSGVIESSVNRVSVGAIDAKVSTPAINSLVSERDSLVSERDSLVSERDSLVSERDSLVSERDSLVDSLSWRLTKFLRVIHKLFNRS